MPARRFRLYSYVSLSAGNPFHRTRNPGVPVEERAGRTRWSMATTGCAARLTFFLLETGAISCGGWSGVDVGRFEEADACWSKTSRAAAALYGDGSCGPEGVRGAEATARYTRVSASGSAASALLALCQRIE